jgi:hypothetical protein
VLDKTTERLSGIIKLNKKRDTDVVKVFDIRFKRKTADYQKGMKNTEM